MSVNANFAATPQCATVQISTANTARDGTGTLGTLYTGAASGSRVDDITITAAGTTTAGVVRFFYYDGTNTRLIWEELVPAITPSTTVAVYKRTLSNLGWILKSASWAIKCSTHNAEAFNVTMTRGGDF